MTKEEQDLADRYGITAEEKTVFYLHGYKYDRLTDAVNYAKANPDGATDVTEARDDPSDGITASSSS